jgi:hypothetical protein
MKGEGVREVSCRKLKVFALAAGRGIGEKELVRRNWELGIGVLQ